MRIGDYFRQRRIEKNLSEEDVTCFIGFQSSMLYDFETFDDNDIDGWSVEEYKRYCSILEVNQVDFTKVAMQDMIDMPLASIVKKRREEKGLSIDTLSNLIEYESIIISNLESNNYNDVCIDFLKCISKELDIPLKLIFEKL